MGNATTGDTGHLEERKAIDACVRRVFEYAYGLDHGVGGAVADLFTQDGEWHAPGVDLVGKDEIRKFFDNRPPGWLTRHVCTNPMIDLTGPDEATGVTYVTVYRSEISRPDYRPETIPGQLGEYRDAFAFEDGNWLISHREVVIAFRASNYEIWTGHK